MGMNWDHETWERHLTRPTATLSSAPSGGEGRERGWFIESLPLLDDSVHPLTRSREGAKRSGGTGRISRLLRGFA